MVADDHLREADAPGSPDLAKAVAGEQACRQAKSASPQGAISTSGVKRELVVDRSDLLAAAREVRDTFATCGRVFIRGGRPVKVTIPSDGGLPRANPPTPDEVVRMVHELRRPVRLAKDGTTQIPTTLPTSVARMYLNMADEWNLPPLKSISAMPLLTPDGSIGMPKGYDCDTGVWFANVPAMKIPLQPERADAAAALRLVRGVFRSFPFADSDRRVDPELGIDVVDTDRPPGYDESAFLVALCTAVCRSNLPLAPGVIIIAPEISGSGTGKGLLARSISMVASGTTPRAFTRGGDNRELEKRLASEMMAGNGFIFIDNLNVQNLHSEFLASILTETSIATRVLHRSHMVVCDDKVFVALTGNGLTVCEDLARRLLPCKLDARCENAEQRKFGAGFLAKIEERRPELLGACLTIWRWGRQHSIALHAGRPLGSFEEWASWCRDPLLTLGCPDPVELIERTKADDPDRRYVGEIFETWRAQHGSRPMKIVELANPVRAIIDPRGRGPHSIAARLSQLTGTCVRGLRLIRHDVAGTAVFALVANGESPPAGGVEQIGSSIRTPTPSSSRAAPPPMEEGQEVASAIGPLRRASGLTIECGQGRIRIDFDAASLAHMFGVVDQPR
jgi:putative DNA primase/helicase